MTAAIAAPNAPRTDAMPGPLPMRPPPERNDYTSNVHFEAAWKQWVTDALWGLVVGEERRDGTCERHASRIHRNSIALAVISSIPVIAGGVYAIYHAICTIVGR